MRREQFSLEISNVAWVDDDTDPQLPTLTIGFDGAASPVDRRLRSPAGERLEASDIDVAVRLQDRTDDPDATGVVALTNRVTGDYVLECNIDVAAMLRFITAARRYGERMDDSARYCIRIESTEGAVATYEKGTLLVYANDGELLRQHSLIPSGVEI